MKFSACAGAALRWPCSPLPEDGPIQHCIWQHLARKRNSQKLRKLRSNRDSTLKPETLLPTGSCFTFQLFLPYISICKFFMIFGNFKEYTLQISSRNSSYTFILPSCLFARLSLLISNPLIQMATRFAQQSHSNQYLRNQCNASGRSYRLPLTGCPSRTRSSRVKLETHRRNGWKITKAYTALCRRSLPWLVHLSSSSDI